MTLLNFLRFDPTYNGAGLTGAGKLQEEVWNRFSGDRAALSLLAATIRSGVQDASELLSQGIDDDETSFPEGTVLYLMHRTRERNSEAIRKAKSRAKKRYGKLECEVCHFDFLERWGEEYIECHHTKPVSQLQPGEETHTEDLALLCANCHRMAHRKEIWLDPRELRKTLQSTSAMTVTSRED
jgi:5-methylcytosine-specific restriction protein A